MKRKTAANEASGTSVFEPSIQDRIIEAAVKCFQRYGVRKTTIGDIAKAAKLSRPTVYRNFPSRYHLIVDVVVREIRDHIRIVDPLLKDREGNPAAILVEAIVLAIATAREHPYTQITTSDAGTEIFARVPGSDQILLGAMSDMLLEPLNRWREEGYLRKDLKLNDAILWIAMFMHSSLSRAEFFGVTEEKMRRMLEGILIPGLFDPQALERHSRHAVPAPSRSTRRARRIAR